MRLSSAAGEVSMGLDVRVGFLRCKFDSVRTKKYVTTFFANVKDRNFLGFSETETRGRTLHLTFRKLKKGKIFPVSPYHYSRDILLPSLSIFQNTREYL
eukprot:UN02619